MYLPYPSLITRLLLKLFPTISASDISSYLQPCKSFSEQISDLCEKYNANKNKHIRSSTLINQPPPPQRISNTTPSRPRILSRYLQASVIAAHLSFSSSLAADLAKLVEHLTDAAERTPVSSLLSRFSNIFDTSKHNISDIVIQQVFNTMPHSPPAFRPHRNPHHREETQKLIDEFLAAGIIHESHSPYAAPAFIVPRKGNRPGRLVVDYRALNKITISDASPLPHIEDTLQELGKGFKTYFSKLDLKSGYHQFQIPQQDYEKTAFVVSSGHYEYSVLPMGPTNGPACFQKTMFNLLNNLAMNSRVSILMISSFTRELYLSIFII